MVKTNHEEIVCKNLRMPEIWRQIKEYGIDFKEKSVLDLGGGHGDFVLLCKNDGAKRVSYIDENSILLYERKGCEGVEIYTQDIEKNAWGNGYDFISCFSVLPYMKNPSDLLLRISESCKTAIIECQYADDGPGFSHIKSDGNMVSWLLKYFNEVENIGKTLVKGRNKYRTIWICSKEIR